MNYKAELKGFDQMLRTLKRMEHGEARKASKQALTPFVNEVVGLLAAAAPIGPTGNLKKSMGKRWRNYGETLVMAIVGARWPLGAHAHMVEFGHKRVHFGHRTDAEGKEYEDVPPKPFMRPVWDSFSSGLTGKLGSKIGELIEARFRAT